MGSIRILQFGGIRPAVEPQLLPLQKAQVAHNTELRRGTLCAYEVPTKLGDYSGDTVFLAPFFDAGTRIVCEQNASIMAAYRQCRGTDEVLVFYRDGRPPVVQDQDGGQSDLLPIAPTVAPKATLVSDGAEFKYSGVDQRVYTYTWVHADGVESRPAPPSSALQVHDGATVSLVFPTAPSGVVGLRIYRNDSPLQAEYGSEDKVGRSVFQLLVDIDPVTTFSDTMRLKEAEFGALLTTDNCDPPTMEQVMSTEDGYLVGFTGREFLFSEVGEPHNWPMRYRFEIPHKIVGMAVWQNSVFLGTTGNPYRIDIAQPEGEEEFMRYRITRYDGDFPLAARDAITATADGAAMASVGGMIQMDRQGARLATRDRIDEELWDRAWDTTLLAWTGGRLYGRRADGVGYVMGWQGADSLDIGDLVTVDWNPVAAYAAPDGALYYLQDGAVWTWDTGTAKMPWRWVSRVYRADGWMKWAAAKIVGQHSADAPVTFRLFGDGRLYYERMVKDNRPFRLPPEPRGIEWEIEVLGTACIREIHVATSMTELTETGGQG